MWGLILIILVYSAMNAGSGGGSLFNGITETREVEINTENAVKVGTIHVLPGQEVEKGDLLVELHRPDLLLKINTISHQIEELTMEKQMKEIDIASQISKLESEKKSVASEISYKIKQLEARQALNEKLSQTLPTLQGERILARKTTATADLLSLEIEALKTEKKLSLEGIQLRIQILTESLSSIGKPLSVHIQSLEKELSLLQAEKSRLLIRSEFEGLIGSVYFKPGETVSPFVPILTVHTRTPSYVRGFIPETVYNQVHIGQEVHIHSLTAKDSHSQGEIVGVGSRIVDYPVRLRQRPELEAWGREVLIRIKENNQLLLGEKVVISTMGELKSSLAGVFGDFISSAHGMKREE